VRPGAGRVVGFGREPAGGPPGPLLSALSESLARPAPAEADHLVAAVRERHGRSVAGVLLYGSCLRSGDLTDGLVDLYVIVDDYRTAYKGRGSRVANRLLPPNVFYLERGLEPAGGRGPGREDGAGRGDGRHGAEPVVLRAKYAVLSLAHLVRGCRDWFHPYLWARFAQPARLLYARDEGAARAITRGLAEAPLRFLAETHPLLAGQGAFDPATLWRAGLARTYASELRAERGRANHLARMLGPELERLTELAAPGVDGLEPAGPGRFRSSAGRADLRSARRRWRLRRVQGRLLSVLRLVKAAWTFEGGIDYLAWKLERHTGERVEVTPLLRRHPIVGGLVMLGRLLRRGTVR